MIGFSIPDKQGGVLGPSCILGRLEKAWAVEDVKEHSSTGLQLWIMDRIQE
jgi:hypothetical protein